MVVSRMVKFFGVMLALCVAMGCSSDKDNGDDDDNGGGGGDDTSGPPPNPTGQLTIAFNPMYSAYIDDAHPCKIPAIVTGLTGANWKASDDSIASLKPDEQGVMITTKKAGTTDITAWTGTLAGTAPLTVTSFTAAEWDAGEARYNSDVKYTVPTMAEIQQKIAEAMMMQGDAGGGGFNPGAFRDVFSSLIPPDNAACTNCHGEGASMLSVQHTSQQIGGFSDDDLIKIITMGMKPVGALNLTMIPAPIYQIFHTWDAASIDDTTTKGIVAYLRSLEPKAQGPIDFQGFGPMGVNGGAQPQM
jgi:hypothetical protein